MKSLKETYEEKSSLIAEAVDVAQLKEAVKVMDQIDALIPEGCNQFKAASQKARDELQKSIAGGMIQKAKELINNPFESALVLATCISEGLKGSLEIVNLYVGPETKTSEESIYSTIPQPDKKKRLIASLIKAFEPTKALANNPLAKIGIVKVPYVQNLGTAVTELVNTSNYKKLEEAATKATNVASSTKKTTTASAADIKPESGTSTSATSNKTTGSDKTASTSGTKTSQSTSQTTGNSQQQGAERELPAPEKISKIKSAPGLAKNAFNAEVLGKLSNAQIKSNFKAIADSLGIKIT